MAPRSRYFLLVCLCPVYIYLAIYFFPSLSSSKVSSLLRLAAQQNLTSKLRALSPLSSALQPSPSESLLDNMSPIQFVPRRSEERGNADHDWLKTFHTFSFAMYHDISHDQFGSLRVINEDRVAPHTGFGTHTHREFEIFSYVVAGELEHKDSMGNIEILKRGDLQLTSAGTGISHSEKAHGSKQVHFLQIWSIPSVSRLPPKYFTRHFTDAEKKNKFVRVVAPINAEGVSSLREDTGPAPVQSPLNLFATILSPSVALSHKFLAGPQKQRKGYVHVIQRSGYNAKAATGATVRVTGEPGTEVELREGDGVYIYGETGKELKIENVGDRVAEVLLFDLE